MTKLLLLDMEISIWSNIKNKKQRLNTFLTVSIHYNECYILTY